MFRDIFCYLSGNWMKVGRWDFDHGPGCIWLSVLPPSSWIEDFYSQVFPGPEIDSCRLKALMTLPHRRPRLEWLDVLEVVEFLLRYHIRVAATYSIFQKLVLRDQVHGPLAGLFLNQDGRQTKCTVFLNSWVRTVTLDWWPAGELPVYSNLRLSYKKCRHPRSTDWLGSRLYSKVGWTASSARWLRDWSFFILQVERWATISESESLLKISPLNRASGSTLGELGKSPR